MLIYESEQAILALRGTRAFEPGEMNDVFRALGDSAGRRKNR